jgi:hypothetical protein
MGEGAQPRVEGPISGGQHGWPFGAPLFDLAERGYVQEEFFLEGEAATYKAVGELGRDGVWEAEPDGTVPYRTRILVQRPLDPARCNGTVVVCWNNVTAGYELFSGESGELLDGYVFVGASVQRVGVHGFPTNPQGLAAWDPERYGSLSIPTDDASYDIFTQVARAVGKDRDRTNDPLRGLEVRQVLALGASQSAGRLGTYVNAIHPRTHAFDGYLLQIYFGGGSPLQVGEGVINIADAGAQPRDPWSGLRGRNLLRELDVPVMVVNSELEAIACGNVRQPDTDRFVWWESAGTCHVSYQSMVVRAAKYEREFGVPQPIQQDMNRMPILPLYDAALHHLARWAAGGEPPPSQPKVELAGQPLQAVRDGDGIALGGIRLPQVEVPVAVNSAIPAVEGIYGLLYGSCRPLPEQAVRERWPEEGPYLEAFEAAARRAVDAGVLLPRDVAPLLGDAAEERDRVLTVGQLP